MSTQVVAAEVYPWRTWKMKENAMLYIVLGDYMTVEDKIEPFIQDMGLEDEDFQEEKAERVHLIKKTDKAEADEL